MVKVNFRMMLKFLKLTNVVSLNCQPLFPYQHLNVNPVIPKSESNMINCAEQK